MCYSVNKHDQYGFTRFLEDDNESSLLSLASRKEQQAMDIINARDQYRCSVAVKWQNYLLSVAK